MKKLIVAALVVVFMLSTMFTSSIVFASDETASTEKAKGASLTLEGDIPIDEAHFPDANFRKYLKQEFGEELTQSEIDATTIMRAGSKNISELTGIEYFTAVESLYCDGNQLETLDLSKNAAALRYLYCQNNRLRTLDISKNTIMRWVQCNNNQLTTLNVSNNTILTELTCGENQLKTLDVSNNTELGQLWCQDNQLTTLDISKNTGLEDLRCGDNQLTTLDVSNKMRLRDLRCENNQLKTLELNNSAVTSLVCNGNQLKTLDLKSLKNSEYLYCAEVKDNFLIALNLPNETMVPYDGYPNDLVKNQRINTITLNKTDELDLHTIDPTLIMDRVSNLRGAVKENDKLAKLTPGTPITYDYYCGKDSAGEDVIMNVTINLRGINDWKQDPSITGWAEGEQTNDPQAEALWGTPEFTYSDSEEGTYTSDVPTKAGTWYMKAHVNKTDDYTGLDAIVQFVIDDKKTDPTDPTTPTDPTDPAGPVNPDNNGDNGTGGEYPQTGDNSPIGALLALIGASAAVLGGVAVTRKKQR